MAIEKYATEAFVLASFDSSEHDRAYKLFTKEFGLLIARATSIRKEKSKLRAHLHVGRISKVTFVKGREIWRIVGAEELTGKDSFTSEITRVLERFIRGGGHQKKLFEHVHELALKNGLDKKMKRLLAYYLILVDLGYADAEVIGAENISVYRNLSIDEFYTKLILRKDEVRKHVANVLSDIQL